MVADAKHPEDDLAAVLADQDDLDPALAHDKQRVSRVVLEQDDAAARIGLLPRDLSEPRQLGAVQAAQQRD
jgi:hypothetical protein